MWYYSSKWIKDVVQKSTLLIRWKFALQRQNLRKKNEPKAANRSGDEWFQWQHKDEQSGPSSWVICVLILQGAKCSVCIQCDSGSPQDANCWKQRDSSSKAALKISFIFFFPLNFLFVSSIWKGLQGKIVLLAIPYAAFFLVGWF